MRCDECDNGERHRERRARVAEREGRTALVLEVPVEVCDSCAQVWLTMETAKRLDAMFRDMLSTDLEIVTRHFDTGQPDAA